jgi:hypothetical protein
LTAVQQTNSACLARTVYPVVCLVRTTLRHNLTGARTETWYLLPKAGYAGSCGFSATHRKQRRKSPFLVQNGVFNLDRTAAFMYKSRVLLDRSKAHRRAVERPRPTVLSPRLRQTERGSPRASCFMSLTLCASTGNIRNSRFGAKF